MVTINFRMWSKKAGKYFYGPEVYECLAQQYAHDHNLFYLSWNHIGDGMAFEQFIGVRDVNGKDVYEGDIIKGDLFNERAPTMGKVIFDDNNSCYASKNEGGVTHLYKICNIDVVGNCHEGTGN